MRLTKSIFTPIYSKYLQIGYGLNKFYIVLILFFPLFCQGQETWLIEAPQGFNYYLTTEIKKDQIIGSTRKNALKEIVGGFKYTIVKMATTLDYPEIVYFEGDMNGNVINGNFHTLFSKNTFQGLIKEDSLLLTILNKNGSKTELKGSKVDNIKPIRDYATTFREIFELTEQHVYKAKFINTKQWRKFKKRMLRLSPNIQDDLELQTAVMALAREFPFSHYYIYRAQTQTCTKQKCINYAHLEEINTETCVLKVKSFSGTKEEMDSLISIIDQKGYKNLIIDLRNNSGGSFVPAFSLAEYLIDEPVIAGVFPNRNWYKAFDRLPTKDDYSKFTEFSGGSLGEWYDKAAQNYGAYFKLLPGEKHFKGNIYILTNRRTASTCEPFVYGLKNHKHASIVGENTAGAMLSSNQFRIENELILQIPLNDYITYSGVRLDKTGVEPDIKVAADTALDYVLNEILTDKKDDNSLQTRDTVFSQ